MTAPLATYTEAEAIGAFRYARPLSDGFFPAEGVRQMKTKDRPTYTITLRPEAGAAEEETLRGIRWLLKRAKRNYHLECVGLGYSNGDDNDDDA